MPLFMWGPQKLILAESLVLTTPRRLTSSSLRILSRREDLNWDSEGQPEADISLESQQTQTNGISDAIEKVSSAEELAVDDKATSKRSLIDFQSLPTRSYLQQTVIPILEEGLTSLTQDRDDNNRVPYFEKRSVAFMRART
uniref:Uncharacterized protein n=1 Tax=Timema poppense TaxID=170557 RepID=A0A7R9DJM8_TIMPO|nr:unnamed protein product [Timema poppensis]